MLRALGFMLRALSFHVEGIRFHCPQHFKVFGFPIFRLWASPEEGYS